MIDKTTLCTASCGGYSIPLDSYDVRRVYALTQLPLVQEGFISKPCGLRFKELTLEGKLPHSRLCDLTAFVSLLESAPASVSVDSMTFTGCCLVQTSITQRCDSRIDTFVLKIRSVENVQTS